MTLNIGGKGYVPSTKERTKNAKHSLRTPRSWQLMFDKCYLFDLKPRTWKGVSYNYYLFGPFTLRVWKK